MREREREVQCEGLRLEVKDFPNAGCQGYVFLVCKTGIRRSREFRVAEEWCHL